MDWIDQDDRQPHHRFGVSPADALLDYDADEQCRIICGELARPKRIDTIRGKLMAYWRIVQPWASERPDLFDTILFEYVAEIEARHASAPGGSGTTP